MASNPDEAQSIVCKTLKLPSDVSLLLWPNNGPQPTEDVLVDMKTL